MEKQFLLENETISVTSDDGSVILTNLRVLKNNNAGGKDYFISMHLQNISTIESHFKSSPALLFMSLVSAIFGAFFGARKDEFGLLVAGILMALLFTLLYFFTRHHVITIASNGGTKINVNTRMKRDIMLDFVRKIDQAKSLLN